MTYHETQKTQTLLKLRSMQKELPAFAAEFLRGIGDYTTNRTRLGYAYDLRIFFKYLTEEVAPLTDKTPREITLTDLANLTAHDIELFLDYLSYYIKEPQTVSSSEVLQNEARGKSRKLSAVRSMFKYFYRKEKLPANPAELVPLPRLTDKHITTLEVDEIARLLDTVESGAKSTSTEKRYHSRTKERDLALITLLLGTGMRVSECVGIDLRDIDFEVNGVKVVRKGGAEAVLYFGEEVAEALLDYMSVRAEKTPIPGHENALFLSMQNRRITDRAVQNLVKKYAARITTLKNISPHKLRSTFGTELYKETGDIYLVANVLGHADVNTTRKHYAKMDDERRRKAANVIKLRR